MSSNFIGPPKRNFDQLFRLVENELNTMRSETLDASVVVAILLNATQGNGFFCCGPDKYREAMNELMVVPGFKAAPFLAKAVPVTGFRRGQVPRFRFSAVNLHNAEMVVRRFGGNQIDVCLFACNWGIAQLPAIVITKPVADDYKLQYLRAFVGDVNMQVRELIRLLVLWQMDYGGKIDAAVWDLHSTRALRGDYDSQTARVMDLAQHLKTVSMDMSPAYKV